MSTQLFFLGAALAILLVIAGIAIVAKGKSKGLPYETTDALFSPAERSFLGVLDQAAGSDYRVFGKVRIADVVAVRKTVNSSVRASAFNKISSKHFDFVLCRANDLKVVCVIELDDKSHNASGVKKRDSFVAGVCAASMLPLLRVPAKYAYTVTELRQALIALIQPEEAVKPSAGLKDAVPCGTPADTSGVQPSTDAPICPKCASGMLLRQLTSGPKAGTAFWGCNNFPRCRGCIPA
ncbi:DUF2726 domain-containing protein [Pseudoduganella sp. GCM10020061]|uniref:DUF2726 domain-containing protein n=1 Tax=Pseudoduganella sp. GCM10020061 TaxID=3317345 RepID=UPI00366B0676